MQAWIAIFFILLASAELYQSVKDVTLPFPVYLVLGVVLAVASNYGQNLSLLPAQKVTLQEIKEPDPALTAIQTPLLDGSKNSDGGLN
jgi:hypothetical protein